jgi:hypothetical protein
VTAAVAEQVWVEHSWCVGTEGLTVEFEAFNRTRCGLSFEEPDEMAKWPPCRPGRQANVDEDLASIANEVNLDLRRLENDTAVAERLGCVPIDVRARDAVLLRKHSQCLGGATE